MTLVPSGNHGQVSKQKMCKGWRHLCKINENMLAKKQNLVSAGEILSQTLMINTPAFQTYCKVMRPYVCIRTRLSWTPNKTLKKFNELLVF